MAELQRFSFHAGNLPVKEDGRGALRGVRGGPEAVGAERGFNSDEDAARYHLDRLLATDDRPGLRSVRAPERAERVPDLRLQGTEDLKQTNTRLVTFTQTKDDIPIFAAKAVCEIDQNRDLVSASGRVGRVKDVSPLASLSPEQAWKSIADFTGEDPGEPVPGVLNFYEDEKTGWHLVWVFDKVPVAPPQMREHAKGHGLGASPRSRHPLVTYLVDAHNGRVVFYFSDTPLFAEPLPVPVKGSGIGEEGGTIEFWGEQVGGGRFQLSDPLRDIKTYDLALGDIDTAVLADPYESDKAHLGDGCRGLISAHANATRVYDFINGVLLRRGINGLGMDLVNVVNVTYAADEQPPAWHNAVWWDDRMWYGQAPGDDGSLVSFSRHLDVIAHELTHGITQYTADLVYKDQSGALNESFSDIFGIIVKNWQDPDGGDVGSWDWQLGRGLGPGGAPLRDLSDPASTGDPAHMDDYVVTPYDEGGVHTNSNIHNKAAHNVLTATDESGAYVFTPREVSYLYYLALTRLGRLDGFSEALEALVAVAMTYYGGDEGERDAKVAALRNAYDMVGIS